MVENITNIWIISVAASLVLLLVAWKWTNAGTVLFALLFTLAGILNFYFALHKPQVYWEYANLNPVSLYKTFIEGFFSQHTKLIVTLIAVGQLAIGFGLATQNGLKKYAAAGAILFLIAIAPLGMGSAFPSTLILAAGAWILMRRAS
jgi:hypothetical protein